jgi:CspA family cold shock protein
VEWLNNCQAFGFIGRENGPDIFVHYNEIASEGFRSYKKEVELEIVQGPKGALSRKPKDD